MTIWEMGMIVNCIQSGEQKWNMIQRQKNLDDYSVKEGDNSRFLVRGMLDSWHFKITMS
jgi:hypothetical protein